MNHFAICDAYGNQPCEKWAEINNLNSENIIQIGIAIEKRLKSFQKMRLVRPQLPTPGLQAAVEQRKDVRKKSFASRVQDPGNSLSDSVKLVKTPKAFRKAYRKAKKLV